MTRHYTPAEMERLAPFADHFRTAVEARWSRYPGRDALALINDTYNAATGGHARLTADCGVCLLRLMRDAGKLYFDTLKAQAEAKAEEAPAPAKKAPAKRRAKK